MNNALIIAIHVIQTSYIEYINFVLEMERSKTDRIKPRYLEIMFSYTFIVSGRFYFSKPQVYLSELIFINESLGRDYISYFNLF